MYVSLWYQIEHFHGPPIPSYSTYSSFPSPKPPATSGVFTISPLVLLFAKCYLVEIIAYKFLAWLLSFSNMLFLFCFDQRLHKYIFSPSFTFNWPLSFNLKCAFCVHKELADALNPLCQSLPFSGDIQAIYI